MIAQFTAKRQIQKKLSTFSKLKSCSIKKSHMFFAYRNYLFSDFTRKKILLQEIVVVVMVVVVVVMVVVVRGGGEMGLVPPFFSTALHNR